MKYQVLKKGDQVSVMILTDEHISLNETDYFLINESTIRKEKKSETEPEPELIEVINSNGTFLGVFKRTHVADGDNDAALCWARIDK